MVVGQYTENPKNNARLVTGWDFTDYNGKPKTLDQLKEMAKKSGTYSIDENLEKPDHSKSGIRYYD